jgi:hypothetical protein
MKRRRPPPDAEARAFEERQSREFGAHFEAICQAWIDEVTSQLPPPPKSAEIIPFKRPK